MSKYITHSGHLDIDTSTTMNYDIKELMTNIVNQQDVISWGVMGRETKGIIFVSIDPTDSTKLICHGSMSNEEQAEALSSENFLWVLIDKEEGSAVYRARFLTFDCAKNINRDDFAMSSTNMQQTIDKIMVMAEKAVGIAATTSYKRGFIWGAIFASLAWFIVILVAMCFI